MRKEINLKNSGWIIISSTLCISILIFWAGYRKFWRYFHIVLFPQGNYLFDKESVIIQLYPSNFFIIYIAGVIGIMSITGALLIFAEKNRFLDRFLRDEKFLSTDLEIKSHGLYQDK